MLKDAQRAKDWLGAFEALKKGEKADYDELLKGYKAGVDAPVSEVYLDLVKRDPELKVRPFRAELRFATPPSLPAGPSDSSALSATGLMCGTIADHPSLNAGNSHAPPSRRVDEVVRRHHPQDHGPCTWRPHLLGSQGELSRPNCATRRTILGARRADPRLGADLLATSHGDEGFIPLL